MSNPLEDEIRRLIDIYESTKELKKAGYLESVLNMMKDPNVIRHIMSKYDMVWRTPSDKYPELMDTWRKLLNKAQTASNVNPVVLESLYTHIVDMTTVRPDKTGDEHVKPIDKSYGVPESDVYVASEPESAYGNSVSYDTDSEWNSVRRGHRPKKGVPVLVAGWHYAGAVEQCVGVWEGNGKWDLRLPDSYNKPKFIPLLWRYLPDVPDSIMEELPE